MLILVSNDDGVRAPGLKALADALRPLGRVVVVAPDRERSAAGRALTLHRPLRLHQLSPDWYAVDGTPIDCVHLGVHGILQDLPDLLVSGINQGGNLGDDITYSGTVGLALEGTLFGIPSFAVSLAGRSGFRFEAAAQVSHRVAVAIGERGLPAGTALNVNVPEVAAFEDLRGFRVTRQGRRVFGSGIEEKVDPRGLTYYWIGARELGHVEGEADTDVEALAGGFVSITPIRTDLSDHAFMDELRGWLP